MKTVTFKTKRPATKPRPFSGVYEYRSPLPNLQALPRKQFDGSALGRALDCLEHGDKEGLFANMEQAQMELRLRRVLFGSRVSSNTGFCSTLQRLAENYGLQLPNGWHREYFRRKQHKLPTTA